MIRTTLDDGQPLEIRFKYGKGYSTATVCEVTLPGEVLLGAAFCAPQDNFCRATGRKIALKRAVAWMPRETRRKIWAAYHQGLKASKERATAQTNG